MPTTKADIEPSGSPDGAPTPGPTTQRAYTLRLRVAVDANDDAETTTQKRRDLSDALWATHEAVNNGAKAFGDWLLTLRGGCRRCVRFEGGPEHG